MNILFVVRDIKHHSPIGIMHLSSIAKQKGHKTFLAALSKDNLEYKIQETQPDVVAYTGSTGEHKYFKDPNKMIRKKHPEIVRELTDVYEQWKDEMISDKASRPKKQRRKQGQ